MVLVYLPNWVILFGQILVNLPAPWVAYGLQCLQQPSLSKTLKFQTGETSITETVFFDPVLQRNHHVFYWKMSI